MGKAVALSGHRILKKDFDYNHFKKIIENLIESGYNIFYVGMARGFDIAGCKILKNLKENNANIKIVACIPCREQDKYFNDKEKKEYNNCLKFCDEIIYITDNYVSGCMQMRNRFMIDNCNLLLAYLYKEIGGTFYTVNYAKRKDKEILYI
jgi:uncharacterized phage-like protein YoqJ